MRGSVLGVLLVVLGAGCGPTRTAQNSPGTAATREPEAVAAKDEAKKPPAPAESPFVEELNLDFEAVDAAKTGQPVGWYLGGDGYRIELDREHKKSGERSLRLTFEKDVRFGVATNTFPVERARGKRLRLTGYLKSRDITRGFAGLWLRVDGPKGALEFDNMGSRGVTGTTDWKRYQIELDVAKEAVNINFGALLTGNGVAWVDGLSIELLPMVPKPPAVIEGVVAGPSGEPVAGARVALNTPYGTKPALMALSGADGRFRFEAPGGRYALTATKRGHRSAYNRPLVFAGKSRVTLNLGSGGFTVSGRVLGAGGKPQAGIMLTVVRISDDEGDLFYVESDADGRYEITLWEVAKGYGFRLESDEYFLHEAAEIKVGVDQTVDLAVYKREVAAEAVVRWIADKAVALTTVEAGHGFADMKPLRRAIGKTRVVALGEATHGSREFFQLKHRMLEFLVEEMGFSVFAIEANWPEALAVNEYVLHGTGDPKKALAGMYFWTWNTEEVLELIEWMRRYNADPRHRRKIKFYGVDMQTAKVAHVEALKYLDKVDPEYASEIRPKLEPIGDPGAYRSYPVLAADRRAEVQKTLAEAIARLDKNRRKYHTKSGKRDWVIGRQQFVILQQAEAMYSDRQNGFDIRDRSMAANLQWILATEGRGTRVVLWAHNGHVQKGKLGSFTTMGMHLARALRKNYMAFGFAFNQGSFQAIGRTGARSGGLGEHTVGPAPPGNVGAVFARTKLPLFALDLRRRPRSGPVKAWFEIPHMMRSLGAVFSSDRASMRVVKLTELFDVMLFVDKTTRARPVKAPASAPKVRLDK